MERTLGENGGNWAVERCGRAHFWPFVVFVCDLRGVISKPDKVSLAENRARIKPAPVTLAANDAAQTDKCDQTKGTTLK